MKHPGLYNPCKDGFAAKAWECLRRNEEFIKCLATWRAVTDPDDSENAYYDVIISPALSSGNELALKMVEDPDVWDLNKTWPQIPQEARREVQALFEPSSGPTFNYGHPQFLGAAKMAAIWDLKGDPEGLAEFNLFVLVPRFIRDTNHRNALKKQFNEQILPKKTFLNARWLKPGGRVLGAQADWRGYLSFEAWRRLDFNQGECLRLAALETYDEVNFGRHPGQRQQAAVLQLKDSGQPKRFDLVVDQFRCVERSIQSVFPFFDPYFPVKKSRSKD